MKTVIKKLPVVAFVLALVAVLAFTVPEKAKDDQIYYFQWNGGSSTGSFITNDIEEVCPETSGSPCAMAFESENVDTSVNPPVLRQNALNDPDAFDVGKHYKEE